MYKNYTFEQIIAHQSKYYDTKPYEDYLKGAYDAIRLVSSINGWEESEDESMDLLFGIKSKLKSNPRPFYVRDKAQYFKIKDLINIIGTFQNETSIQTK